MATLAAAATATDDYLSVSNPAQSLAQGTLVRIDDEVLRFEGYGGNSYPGKRDYTSWMVYRGRNGTTPAAHAQGATVQAAVDAFLAGTFGDPPGPFDAGAGGASDAASVSYDNAESGLTAEDVQAALDEVVAEGGGGSLSALVDPGNVWEPDTAVAEGYRIAETVLGELRVFEASLAGTTITGSVWTDFNVNLTPLGLTTDDTPYWRYLGIVGRLSWEAAPVLDEISVHATAGLAVVGKGAAADSVALFRLLPKLTDPGNVWEAEAALDAGDRIAETVDGQLRVFEITGAGTTDLLIPDFDVSAIGQTTSDGTAEWSYFGIVGGPDSERPVFEAKTDGDADWFLDLNAGGGFRFGISENGVLVPDSGQTQITTDGFSVQKPGAGAGGFHVTYDPFTVQVTGLPTADPSSAGQLFTDGVPGAADPKALKVSGG